MEEDLHQKQMKDKCLKLLREYTQHENVKFTSLGDSAIFGALSIAKQHGYTDVIIPDQGGWLSYQTFPLLLDMHIINIKTDQGILLVDELKKYTHAALLFSSFAGYAAAQDLTQIASIAKQNDFFIIEDASGAVSHKDLCNGAISDIIIASFGRWKIVNLGNGGFLSIKKKYLTQQVKESDIFSLIKPNNLDYNILYEKLKKAPGRLQFLLKKTKEVKQLCQKEKFELIHADAEGIAVFVKFKSDKEKEKIITFCKQHTIAYKECPMYIKILEKAISMEIKRMECII
ncbi:MAG: DegT/DnrJ/EryC1/StrS family aminotransferase [Candidatus Woesearchaeota archaeon]|jgi:hypothetical protein